MSHSASIDITLVRPFSALREPIDIYLRHGWSLDDHGRISFTALGDPDLTEWTEMTVDPDVLLVLLDEKDSRGEPAAVTMLDVETGTGGNLLLWSRDRFSMSLSIDRRGLDGAEPYSDFSWYLRRLLVPLQNECHIPFRVTCHESL